jgi:hypothetical protein
MNNCHVDLFFVMFFGDHTSCQYQYQKLLTASVKLLSPSFTIVIAQ